MSEVTTEKKTRNRKPCAVYPAVPSSVSEINGDFIVAFFADKYESGSISDEEFTKWIETYETIQNGEQNVSSFNSFREQFAKAFYPQVFAKKDAPKKPTLLEQLKAIKANKQ